MISKEQKSISSLLIANVLTLILAIIQGWSFGNLIWIFFFQGVIIGFFNFFSILTAQNYIMGNISDGDGKLIKSTKYNKKFIAFFFLFHFGLFNFIYFLFLKDRNYNIDWHPFIFLLIVFLINNIFTFILEFNNQKNIGRLFALPYYARILPMSAVIWLGLFLANNIYSTVFFLIIKIFTDVYMQWALYDITSFNKLRVVVEKHKKFISLIFILPAIATILYFFYSLYSSIKISQENIANNDYTYLNNVNPTVKIIKSDKDDFYGDVYYSSDNQLEYLIAKSKTIENKLASSTFNSIMFTYAELSPNNKYILLLADCWEISCVYIYDIENKIQHDVLTNSSYVESQWAKDNKLVLWQYCDVPFKFCGKYITKDVMKPWDIVKVDTDKKIINATNTANIIYAWDGISIDDEPYIKIVCNKALDKDKRNINDIVSLLQNQFLATSTNNDNYKPTAELRLDKISDKTAYLEVGMNNLTSNTAEIFMAMITLTLTPLDDIDYVAFNFYIRGSHGYGINKKYSKNDFSKYKICNTPS